MTYLEDFLTNKKYKCGMSIIGIMFVLFTLGFHNSTNDYKINNNNNYTQNYTNYYDDDYFYNYDDDDLNDYVYSPINFCQNLLNNIQIYRINDGIMIGILTLLLMILNYDNISNRKIFCYTSLIILLVNIIWASYILVIHLYNECYKIYLQDFKIIEGIFIANYSLQLLLLLSFTTSSCFSIKVSQNQINQIRNRNNETDALISINDPPSYDNVNNLYPELPKYSFINNKY